MDYEEAHPQEDPQDDSQSVEDSIGNRPKSAVEGIIIDCIEPFFPN